MTDEKMQTVLRVVGNEADHRPLGPISFYAYIADIFGSEVRSEALKLNLYNNYESTNNDEDAIHSL